MQLKVALNIFIFRYNEVFSSSRLHMARSQPTNIYRKIDGNHYKFGANHLIKNIQRKNLAEVCILSKRKCDISQDGQVETQHLNTLTYSLL
jgi:hypothetical protein